MKNIKDEIYDTLIKIYGVSAQEDQCIEEMAELTKALIKHRKKPCYEKKLLILDELVDVEILLEQMKRIHVSEQEFQEHKSKKLLRQKERLGL